MKLTKAVVGLCILALAGAGARAAEAPARRMSRAVLEDKVRGGWAGQMIGVAYGAPTEFRSNGKINEGELKWTPDMIENTIHQDDLYVEMTFAEVMDRVGLEATTEQYGEMFRDSKYSLWHANAGARRNLNRGIKAPMSGHPDYNVHANDIDFQIESDFIGLMTPGLPQASNHYADRVGRVMNYGDGLYGGMLFGAMYAAAYFETDPHRVVEEGLKAIPAESGYARLIRDVLAWHAQDPTDWRKTWQRIEEKWNRDDLCPDGALVPFNIDARVNGAYVVLGPPLRRRGLREDAGDLDPRRAGLRLQPVERRGDPRRHARLRADPGEVEGRDPGASRTRSSSSRATRSTRSWRRPWRGPRRSSSPRAARWAPTRSSFPSSRPRPRRSSSGTPACRSARVELDQPAWSWKGGWTTQTLKNEWSSWKVRQAGGAGDEATLAFEGTGVAIVGTMSQEGGRADVYLDGAKAGEIDAWIPERTNDNDYWHVTGLANGPHTVRIVVRGDADARSKGRAIRLERAIVYGPRP